MQKKFMTTLLLPCLFVTIAMAQGTDPKAAIGLIKKNLQTSTVNLSKMTWIETTTVYKGDEVKSETKNQCSYGLDGKISKVPIAAPAADAKSPRGVRGKIVENKKEEISDYIEKSVAKVHTYLPPNPEKLQAINAAGKVNIQVTEANKRYTLNFPDYLQAGDQVAISLNMAKALFEGIMVKTYLDKPDDKVNFNLKYAVLPDGTEYPAETILDLPKEGLKIVIKNDGHRMVGG